MQISRKAFGPVKPKQLVVEHEEIVKAPIDITSNIVASYEEMPTIAPEVSEVSAPYYEEIAQEPVQELKINPIIEPMEEYISEPMADPIWNPYWVIEPANQSGTGGDTITL